jgi:hypothetical protein
MVDSDSDQGGVRGGGARWMGDSTAATHPAKALMGSRGVVGQTCPKHREPLEAPLQHGYTLDNSIAPCLPSWAAADHQRAVGVFSAFRRPSQPFLPSQCRNAGMFSSRPSQT